MAGLAQGIVARLKREAIVAAARALRDVPNGPLKHRLMMRVGTTGLFVGAYDQRFEVRTRFGATIRGNTRDMVQAHIFAFAQWEPHLTSWIPTRLSPGDTFVDVGANIGYFSLLASRAVGPSGAVVAVEALPATYEKLRWHVTTNSAHNVRAVCCAASDQRGELVLHAGPDWNSGMSSTIAPDAWRRWTDSEKGTGRAGDHMSVDFGRDVTVDALPLDEILTDVERARARLVKVDVEGAEIPAIRGMRRLLAEGRRDLEVVVEVNPGLLEADGQKVADVFEPFFAAGFRAYAFPTQSTEGYLVDHWAPPTPLGPVLPTTITEVVFSRSDAPHL